MNQQIERECPACGGRYHANPNRLKHGRETTCSRLCSYQLRAEQLRDGEEVKCGGCDNLVHRSPGRRKPRHGEVFCSPKCAYANRKRIVERPYVITTTHDRGEAAQKAWNTRRANPKPYPEPARAKARAAAIKLLERGFAVSQFEREAAKVLRALGFDVATSAPIRGPGGRFGFVLDIVLHARRLVVECHGNYWHGGRWSWSEPTAAQTNNLGREARKLSAIRAIGYELRLLWEQDFERDPVGACLAAVR